MTNAQQMIRLTSRAVLRLAGAETRPLLQRLMTADMDTLKGASLVYSALLTPQGKIAFDFFLGKDGDDILIDCEAAHADELLRKLMMYRLRAPIEMTRDDGFAVFAALSGGNLPADPRHPAMGGRAILATDAAPDGVATDESAYRDFRLALGIAEGRGELGFEELFALEANLDLLHGMSLTKGCFVGQELAARMTHRGNLKKRLLPVDVEGAAAVGDDILAGDRRAGTLRALSGHHGIALQRLEYLDSPLKAASGGQVTPRWPDWIPAAKAAVDAPG